MLISKTINGSLRLIGVLAAGEEASAVEAQDALERLNGMIDGFNISGLTVSYLQHKTYTQPLAGWKSNITIGLDVANDFNEVAPLSIASAFFRDTGGIDFRMTPMGLNEWSDMVYKAIVAPPRKYYENYHGHTLSLQFDTIPYPLYTLHLVCKTPYVGGYVPTDNIDWDYGFEEMLRYQLAARLAPEYGVQLRPEIAIAAQQLMQNIKRRNIVGAVLNVDTGLQSKIYKGFYHIGSNSTY
jgi:hypothetical protein